MRHIHAKLLCKLYHLLNAIMEITIFKITNKAHLRKQNWLMNVLLLVESLNKFVFLLLVAEVVGGG